MGATQREQVTERKYFGYTSRSDRVTQLGMASGMAHTNKLTQLYSSFKRLSMPSARTDQGSHPERASRAGQDSAPLEKPCNLTRNLTAALHVEETHRSAWLGEGGRPPAKRK